MLIPFVNIEHEIRMLAASWGPTMTTGFVAYPSNPSGIGTVLREALEIVDTEYSDDDFQGWEQNDIAGRFLVDPILEEIDSSDLLVADITKLNFNVVYEIGYAIGLGRRVLLIQNGSLQNDSVLIREVGIFDSLGYNSYLNARQLAQLITSIKDTTPLSLQFEINKAAPVFLVLPQLKTDLETKVLSRVKKAFRQQFRTFDPDEAGPMSGREAIREIATSYGVVIPLLNSLRKDSQAHNMRAAFVAGLAMGMKKELLFLQFGDEPVPLDYRDLVDHVANDRNLDNHFSEFAPTVYASYNTVEPLPEKAKRTLLEKVSLGRSIAENEITELRDYYLETEEFRRVARGETQIVTGRKGSGKTALFIQVRDGNRRNRQNVVLDLRPEGFQLLKFKDVVLQYLEQGTKEHTITAFWEYLLLLELCHKLLEKDKDVHLTNHNLFESYRELSKEYAQDAYVSEGDFAERLLKLLERIITEFKDVIGTGEWKTRLSTSELTNILYQHDTKALEDKIASYLQRKQEVWILFDNLDKGWPATGLSADDVLIVRCLLDAVSKLEKHFRKRGINCHGVVFLRHDVYEIMINHTPDRGKNARVLLDWTDPELLRALLRLRFVQTDIDDKTSFEDIWRQLCVSHIDGQESSTYLIERCLMRPRSLIDLIQYCRSHALNLDHDRIEVQDIREGEANYSSDLVTNMWYEMRDVCPPASDSLYEFVGNDRKISHADVIKIIERAGVQSSEQDLVIETLLWYGFLGVVRENGEVAYIYDVRYDKKRLRALMRRDSGGPAYYINPAFWQGLEIKAD